MLDIQLLRKDLDAVVARLASRGFAFPKDQFVALEAERKHIQTHKTHNNNNSNSTHANNNGSSSPRRK